ncbi:hypothetical protein [Novosphingobium sp. JCM 18896]|uniref:hypothetical protein n=1 Tax=Novosphingobium sp. JCM 18896 TaxID=2989731 RepID=UPI0022227AA2|nr:hypothetical protein [Novosphingobium sp. JCM 18896]MCW1429994.1 hypothetical protein [Novosphingobium sp. JCM 18896]
MPSPSIWPDRISPLARFAILLLVALMLRCDTFGDPNLHGDEVFYHTVGIAMHHGALPYVDLWDRKPFGLFALYYLITAISTAPLAYQLVATLFAVATAATIGAIAARLRPDDERNLGGLLAGACYLLWLAPLQGFGGQSPVFYNLFVALAALLVLRALPALREGRASGEVAAAMLLAGLGITIKTTALFEGAFLGLFSAWVLWRSPVERGQAIRTALLWAMLGAAPTLLIATGYATSGHWPEFWHAMVTSNLAKPPHALTSLIRFGIMAAMLLPFLAIAGFGLRLTAPEPRRFVLLWLAAAFVGLCAVPNFYLHYGMPLLVPLCVAAAPYLTLRGRLWIVVIAVLSFILAQPFDFAHTRQSRAAIADLVATTRAHVGRGPLLSYDGPPQIYRLTGQPLITPLVFPTHLSHLIEKDTSPRSTLGETRRLLALRPGAVVMAEPIRNAPINAETHRLVLAYVGQHCRLIKAIRVPERLGTDTIIVWGDCTR